VLVYKKTKNGQTILAKEKKSYFKENDKILHENNAMIDT
jgi:hypothetical protein